jgi:hypothetical protein
MVFFDDEASALDAFEAPKPGNCVGLENNGGGAVGTGPSEPIFSTALPALLISTFHIGSLPDSLLTSIANTSPSLSPRSARLMSRISSVNLKDSPDRLGSR